MQRLPRPSPAASRSRTSRRGSVAASRQSPAQHAEDRRASWVVRVLMIAAGVGGVLHFRDAFLEQPSPSAVRSPSSPPPESQRGERRQAAVPPLPPLADDVSGVRAEVLDHDGWERAATAEAVAEQSEGEASEAFAEGREPPGDDTGIIITPVAAVARWEKGEPGTEPARVERARPIEAAPAEPAPIEAARAPQHVDPAVDTGIIVTPRGYPASAK